jgi:hypothetical protein
MKGFLVHSGADCLAEMVRQLLHEVIKADTALQLCTVFKGLSYLSVSRVAEVEPDGELVKHLNFPINFSVIIINVLK